MMVRLFLTPLHGITFPLPFFFRHMVPIPCLPQLTFFSPQGGIVLIPIVLEVQISFRTFAGFICCILSYYNSGFMVNHFSKWQEPGVFVNKYLILSIKNFPKSTKISKCFFEVWIYNKPNNFWYKFDFRKCFWTSFLSTLEQVFTYNLILVTCHYLIVHFYFNSMTA